jgi:outer membrane protein OmpA-like peptidoglycan-associated protein
MKSIGLMLIVAGALSAQTPSPVQSNVMPPADGKVPIFRVQVTSRSIRAVNYNHRKGSTKVNFVGTTLMPDARGEAEVTPNDGASRISLKFDHLSNPAQFGPEYLTLVLWGVTPEGRTERLGEVTLRDADNHGAELYATTDLQSFGMIVTAEPYFSVSRPSDVVVMENVIRNDTTGTMEDIEAKYELLRRGEYTANISAGKLTAVTSDLKVPLQLREAREAIVIAKAQGADSYAADTMQKAATDMINAEGYYRSKDLKGLETQAREATQMAEDARRITITKQQDEADQASKLRESNAVASADIARASADEARLRADEEAQRRVRAEATALTAQSATAAAERQKDEALMVSANARDAQRDAEAARLAAIAEQDKLAREKAAAVADRESAEKDTQALRERLKVQLNMILMTRDTARGLIVNMSDVLFDVNQATLRPGAREKLAKVSGILLAYPNLHMTVEGHTDSTGSDEYNIKLSQRRADAVTEYLISNNIASANIQAKGLGKDNPVATNDTAAGRQQNRRVEMVVSGEVIGQPISGMASPLGLNADRH